MKNRPSDWVFNFGLRLGVVVFLGTLALGLLANLQPVTALTRSGVAFVAFVLLAHAASAIWNICVTDEAATPVTNETQGSGVEDAGNASETNHGGGRAAKTEKAS